MDNKFIDTIRKNIDEICENNDDTIFIKLKKLYKLNDKVLSLLRPVEDRTEEVRKKFNNYENYNLVGKFIDTINDNIEHNIVEASYIIKVAIENQIKEAKS